MNRVLALMVLVLASVVSCDNAVPAPSGTPAASTPTPPVSANDRGGSEERNATFDAKWDAFYKSKFDIGDTAVIGGVGDCDSLLDPVHTTRNGTDVIGLLFVGLTRTNPDFSHGPALADSWEFSKDHLELTFKLRKDIFWTDGKPTTAHDVAFTYTKHIDPVIAYSAIKWKDKIQDVVAVDDHTVKFIFKELYPYQLMDATVGAILPRHLLEGIPSDQWKSCEFNRKPVGNGPYKLKEWKAQQFIELEANEKWALGRPPLNRIIFKVIPDWESMVLQLKNGEIDFAELVPPKYHKELDKVAHLRAISYPSRGYVYLGWNMANPLFVSKKVRQALTMAIDRQDIIDSVLYGKGRICKGPVSPIIWAYNPNLPEFPFDPAKAKQLLSEEGWKDSDGDGWLDKNGQTFEFTIKTNKGNQIREDITVIVQDQLKKVGIKVTPNLLEWTIFSDDLNKKKFEASVAGWSVGLKMDLTTMWHTNSINDKFNFVSYSNPEVDKLDDMGGVEMDREKARKIWWKAQELIVDDQPYTFLYIPDQVNYLHKRFQNVQQETVGWNYNLEQWWVKKEHQKYK